MTLADSSSDPGAFCVVQRYAAGAADGSTGRRVALRCCRSVVCSIASCVIGSSSHKRRASGYIIELSARRTRSKYLLKGGGQTTHSADVRSCLRFYGYAQSHNQESQRRVHKQTKSAPCKRKSKAKSHVFFGQRAHTRFQNN